MLLKTIFLYILIFTCTLSGGIISYDELRKKPKSIAKDYYIYRLLAENSSITVIEATLLYNEVNRMTATLQKEFEKKLGLQESAKKVIDCKKKVAKDISSIDEECVKLLVHPPFVASLNKDTIEELIKQLSKINYNFTAGWVEAMSQKDVFDALSKKGAKEFLLVFNAMPSSYKKTHFDRKLKDDFLRELEKEKGYEKLIKSTVIGKPLFSTMQKSLIYSDENAALTHNSFFFLGINAVKLKRYDIAEKFFRKAEQKAYYKSDKDKSAFWRYLMSQNISILENLSNSHDMNIYSLYAKDVLNIPMVNITFLEVPNDKPTKNFNMQDPFEWRNLLDKISSMEADDLESLTETFNTKETLPIYAFLLERASKYKHSYFIEPYIEYMENFSDDRKALILALARKESRFIPASISSSYALGIMQFMPFLARDIAKKLKIVDFDIDDMFYPQIAYKFANIHIDYLSSYLQHPLFIAYAYNGGIGFVRKMLKNGLLFNDGDYEPFLSIETVDYEESREYGKGVLANYIVYSKHLGNDISIKTLLETLTKPSQTDKFRQKD